MLGVILNEKEMVDESIKNGYVNKNPMVTITLLAKYYHNKGMNKDQVSYQINDFMSKNYKEFSINKWFDKINSAINKIFRIYGRCTAKSELINIEKIEITQGELDSISALNDDKLEKIAFIMLVYAKISNIMFDSKDGWINKNCSMICREAKVVTKAGEKKEIFLNQLYNKKYILQGKNNSKTGIKVNYLDEESEVAMVIDDFDEVIYQYLIWKGGKYKKCEGCGKHIKIKSNSVKYCKKCSVEKDKENKLRYWHKINKLEE